MTPSRDPLILTPRLFPILMADLGLYVLDRPLFADVSRVKMDAASRNFAWIIIQRFISALMPIRGNVDASVLGVRGYFIGPLCFQRHVNYFRYPHCLGCVSGINNFELPCNQRISYVIINKY